LIEGLIHKTVQRSNRTILLLGVLAILATAALFALSYRYFYNFALGPFDVSAAELLPLQAGDRPLKYWVRVSGSDLLDTGMQYVTTSDSGTETIEHSYLALVLEDRLLVVKHAGALPSLPMTPTVTGWISQLSDEEKVEVIQAVEKDVPQVAGAFLPFQIEEGNFRANGLIGLIAGGVVILLGFWGILTVIRRNNDLTTHPILKALTRFGPLEFVISRIEGELAMPHTQIKNLHLTNNWLVFDGKTSLAATQNDDVAWVYKHVLTRRSYGIAVSKTYTAILYDRYGVQLTFTAGRKEADVNQMLEAISQRAPWAIAGFSKEIETAWKKDRVNFLAAVDRRKAEARAVTG
jgi:hypothetical protein